MKNFDKINARLNGVCDGWVIEDRYGNCYFQPHQWETPERIAAAESIVAGWTDFTPYRSWKTLDIKVGLYAIGKKAEFQTLMKEPVKGLPDTVYLELWDEIVILAEDNPFFIEIKSKLPEVMGMTEEQIEQFLNSLPQQ